MMVTFYAYCSTNISWFVEPTLNFDLFMNFLGDQISVKDTYTIVFFRWKIHTLVCFFNRKKTFNFGVDVQICLLFCATGTCNIALI